MTQPNEELPESNAPNLTQLPDADEEAKINKVFFAIILVATILIVAHCSLFNFRSPFVALLWAIACLSVGAMVGFLFGLTRVGQSAGKETPAGGKAEGKYNPQINTNLIEISDWLTKIIVGLGLINLKEIPEKLRHIAQVLADCLGCKCGFALALAIIIGFTIIGFLFGYINTRTIIARVLDAADRGVIDPEKVRMSQRLSWAETGVQREAESVVANTREQAGINDLAPPNVENQGQIPVPDAKMDEMAEEYRRIESPDYRDRVSRKDKAVSEMLRYILERKIQKKAVAEWAAESPTDGRIVALAAYILAHPESGDLPRLLAVAKSAIWMHVKYRVTLALRQLCQLDLGQPSEWKQASEVITLYKTHAENRKDFSLLTLTGELQKLLASKFK